MPKLKLSPAMITSTIFESLLTSTQSFMPKDSENPNINSSIVFDKIYTTLNNFSDEFCWSPYTDWSILLFLNKYRYPHIEGDPRSGRLCFDFTLTKEHLGIPKDIASFALYFKHPKTLHCLLQEEQLTWVHEEQVLRGLNRALEPNGFTWLHKSMILASLVQDYYKNSPANELELKEFLQNSMQVHIDLLGKFPLTERVNILRNIAACFITIFQDGVISIFALVCPILLLKDLFEECAYRQLISSLGFHNEKEVAEIAKIYSLDAHSLLLRKKQLTQIQTDLDQGLSDMNIDYLKTRFRLSFLMLDTLLFHQCIGNASILNMEALIESIYDVINSNSYPIISYFLETLPKEIKRKTLDYLFLKHGEKYISVYMSSCDLLQQQKVNSMMNKVLLTTVSSLGTTTDQYAYLQALIKTAITNKLSNLIESLIIFTRELNSPLSQMNPFLDLKEDTGKYEIPALIIKYPLLMNTVSGKYSKFHTNIMKSIELADSYLNEKSTWITYLSLMHISAFSMDTTFYQSECFWASRIAFQTLEYWFDQLLANKSKYLSLWTRMQSCLLATNFFSDPKLKYLLSYKFGEFTDIGLELENARLTLGHGISDKSLTKQYGEKLNRSLRSSETQPLFKDLETMFQSKKGFVDERVELVRSWVLWAESQEEKLGIKPDKYKASKSSRLMLDALINQTPLAEQLYKIAGTPCSPSLFLDGLKSDDRRFYSPSNTIKFVETLVFDAYSSELFFVLLLFLKRSDHKVCFNFMILTLVGINSLCERDPSKKTQYHSFYEVMAKNKFFQHELDNFLINTFYINNLFYMPPSEPLLEPSAFDTQETPLSGKKPKKKKKRHPKTDSSLEELENTPEAEIHEVVSSIPSMLIPIVEEKDVQPPAVGQKSIQLDTLLSEDTMIEFVDSSSDGGSTDEAEETKESIAKKTALRKTQQQLYLIFKYLIVWGQRKIAHLGTESIQAIQYNALINVLEANQIRLRKIRTLVKKFAVDPSIHSEPKTLPLSVFEYLENYGSFIHKMKELTADLKGAELIASLIQDLVIISSDNVMQLRLLDHLMLPEMPIVTKIRTLFSEHAKVFISGTSLFLSNPMDIDFCLEMNNEALSIEEAHALFESIIIRASREEGLGFEIMFSKLFIGIASITVKAKGDGYGLHDYKSMDFTLQLADPSKRLPKLHHTTHSAASLDLLTGKILCSPEIAHAIIQGVFSIHPAALVDPVERYKMDIHVLTTVMRAWTESKLRPLRLDESVICLIEKIKHYKGDTAKLQSEEPWLNKALIGMITRHFKHFEFTLTNAYRTSMLITFLTELGMPHLLTSGAAQGLYEIISNELEHFNYGPSSFVKTEWYLRFCANHPIIRCEPMILKDSLIKILSKHFNQHREAVDYLHKTQCLLDLCKRLGFNVVVQDKLDSIMICCLLVSVNLFERFMVLSTPLLSVDHPSLLIINAPRLLDSNNHAIITAGINRRVYASTSPATIISTMALSEDRCSAARKAPTCSGAGFFAPPITTASRPTKASDSSESFKM